MHNIVGGYTVSQLRVMLDQQQRAKRQRIATLKSEINSRAKELATVIQELEELERAENLLES
jgi:flagellar capping protein FliD